MYVFLGSFWVRLECEVGWNLLIFCIYSFYFSFIFSLLTVFPGDFIYFCIAYLSKIIWIYLFSVSQIFEVGRSTIVIFFTFVCV